MQSERLEEITGLLTVTQAEVSADMEHGEVFFSVVGQDEDAVLEILKKHVYEIQGMLNRRLRMRKTPRIVFVADRSGEYAQHIRQLIKGLDKHDQEQ